MLFDYHALFFSWPKLVEEMRLREGDALAEAQGWRDRLEAQQSDADLQLDAAREEVSELRAKVGAPSVFVGFKFQR